MHRRHRECYITWNGDECYQTVTCRINCAHKNEWARTTAQSDQLENCINTVNMGFYVDMAGPLLRLIRPLTYGDCMMYMYPKCGVIYLESKSTAGTHI